MTPENEFLMYQEINRAKTFVNWPYDHGDYSCNSSNMASAGFFRVQSQNEPDLVKCFICLKELDGWEPEDDPWTEHKKHSPRCSFVKMNKKEDMLTMDNLLKLESERQKNRLRTHYQKQIEKVKEEAVKTRKEVVKIIEADNS